VLGFALVLSLLSLLMAAPAAAGASASSSAKPSYIAAAEYFGTGDPTTLWSSDLATAPRSFAIMKHEGFNTVALVVPWGEFQTGIDPVRYTRTSFAELDRLVTDASHLGMGVVVRLSYELDHDPADQMPGSVRFDALWSNPTVYAAWLDYISTVHQNLERFHNVREAYISWEDLWQPIFEAQAATTTTQQLALAVSSGYRTWLRKNATLTQVSTDYGEQFASWTDVPTPGGHQPSFRLMYQYEDTALINRLFEPAAKRFPGLTMETRVDVDPIYTGTQVVGSYTHSAQYQLAGTSLTGMYFSPYMEDPSSTKVETSPEALAALQSVLSSMSSASGGRSLFIYEYEFVSNSPEVSNDPALTPGQIPAFLAASEPILRKYTSGYALWAYHDYYLSPIYNQSFTLGTSGWKLSSGAHLVSQAGSGRAAQLRRGSAISQSVTATVEPGTPTVSLDTTARRSTTLHVTWGTGPSEAVHVRPGRHTYHVVAPASATDVLTIRATGPVSVTNVQLYWFTQEGDVYGVNGQAEVGVAPLRALNDKLTGS